MWGLRDRKTGQEIISYLASSQIHKALFSSLKKAQDACKFKQNAGYEPVELASVVRCKDCINWGEIMDGDMGTCRIFSQKWVSRTWIEGNGYCVFGERRDAANVHN